MAASSIDINDRHKSCARLTGWNLIERDEIACNVLGDNKRLGV